MKNEKACVNCGNTFFSKSKNTKSCSRSCASKQKWSQPEYKDRVTKSIKIAANNELRNQKISEFHKNYQNLDESKIRQSVAAKNRWADPTYKVSVGDSIRKTLNSNKDKLCAQNKEISNRCEVKLKKKKAMLLLWESTEYRLKMCNAQLIAQNQEITIKKRRASMLNNWKDPVFAANQFKSSVRYKEFVLPSGLVVKLQGYEPQVLDYLLTLYDESDIILTVKNIHTYIGRIFYTQENIKRSYYPDFYIKSINTIIEVKSTYTFKKHIEKNLLKERACLDAGFNFKFIIL